MDTEVRDRRRFLYEQFLRCIDREENLIHYRLTWGIQWNAAILAAVFAMSQLQLPEVLQLVIRILLSILGAASGYLSFAGVNAAFKQSAYLIDEVERRLNIQDDNGWMNSEFLRPFGQRGTVHLPARKAAIRFPWLFMAVWGGFIIYTGVQLLDALELIIVPALR
jgi:hypothetical protein